MSRNYNGGEGSDKFDHKYYRYEQPNVDVDFDIETTICPYGVSPIELARVTKVLVQGLLK